MDIPKNEENHGFDKRPFIGIPQVCSLSRTYHSFMVASHGRNCELSYSEIPHEPCPILAILFLIHSPTKFITTVLEVFICVLSPVGRPFSYLTETTADQNSCSQYSNAWDSHMFAAKCKTTFYIGQVPKPLSCMGSPMESLRNPFKSYKWGGVPNVKYDQPGWHAWGNNPRYDPSSAATCFTKFLTII